MPLAIWFGIFTIISLFITVGLGIAMYRFHKNVFKYHKYFAYLTAILALVHVVLVFFLLY